MEAKEAIQKIKVLLGLEEAPAEQPAEVPAEEVVVTPDEEAPAEETPAEEVPAEAPAQFAVTEDQYNALLQEVASLKEANSQLQEQISKKDSDLHNAVKELFHIVEKVLDQPEADPLDGKKDGFRTSLMDSRKTQAEKIQQAFSELKK